MMLAASEILKYISDHPWPGWRTRLWGMNVTLMSSGIATMLIVAAVLIAGLVLMARRWKTVPAGGANALEVLVMFVRDRIAKPALGERAYLFLPFLMTMFVFILAMNLIGLVPLEYAGKLVGVHIGGTPTTILTVCAGLAATTLLMIVFAGLRRAAETWHEHHGWPKAACWALSPVLWLVTLSPPVPGTIGVIMRVPLSLLEFVGAVGKCLALVIRLFANMLSGHIMLAVGMLFVAEAAVAFGATRAAGIGYIGPIIAMANVLLSILELVVAVLQAYIFTFLAAMFLGLYAEAEH